MNDEPTFAVVVLCILWLILAARLLRRDWATSPTRIWLVAPVVLSVLGIGVVSVLWAIDDVREIHLTNALQDAMRRTDVEVDCQPIDEYALFNEWYYAWADERSGRAHLNYAVCRDLASYSSSAGARENPSDAQLFALVILAHEAAHLNGEEDEYKAHCVGIQNAHRIGQALGATAEQALAARAEFFDKLHGVVDPDYVSPECEL